MLSPLTNAFRRLLRYAAASQKIRLGLNGQILAIDALFTGTLSGFTVTRISGLYHVQMAGLSRARFLTFRPGGSYETAAN